MLCSEAMMTAKSMVQLLKTKILIVLFLFGVIFAPNAWSAVEGKIATFGKTTHLELRGLDHWTYNVEKSVEKKKTKFTVQVPQLSPATLQELKRMHSPDLEKVVVSEGTDKGHVIELTFKSDSIDHFDYLTDRPSRLVVDFFPKAKPAAKAPVTSGKRGKTEAASDDEVESKPATGKNAKIEDKKSRKPATTDVITITNDDPNAPLADIVAKPQEPTFQKTQSGIFDGADPDFSRFLIKDYEIKEEAIIASKQNVYVDFPILRLRPDEMSIMEARMPTYNIHPKETDENKQARLLQTLFEKGRLNVFLKTVDWFFDKYPKSEYSEMIRFMWADTYFKLWRQNNVPADLDMAVIKYQEAIRNHPDSKLADRTQLFIAYSRLERGDNLGALQYFQAYLNQYKDSPNKDLALIAMAEANYNLNRYDDALGLYDQVIEKGLRPQEKIRAAFLKGDVHYKRRADQKAIEEYRKVIAQYPAESDSYPGAYFNLAAALFRSGQYKDSLFAQVEFVKRFPSHSFSGFAMTRVGELLEILGADPARVIGAYLETYFRYGETEGAIVARLRLLSARMKSMKVKELDKAVRDIMRLANDSTLPKMDQFASVMVADGYHRRGEFEKSTDLLVKYYQENPTGADTELLTQRIVRNINDQIHDLVEKQDFIQALKVHQKQATNWLKGSTRIDLKYNLGRAFEQAGVFDEAEKVYRDSSNRLMAIKGTRAEKETGVFERIPKNDEILLRMAAVNVARGNFQVAIQNLRNIEHPDSLTEVQQVERVILASQLYDKKGEPETAVRYLTELVKAWRGIPSLVSEPYYQLGEMESRLGRKESAIQSYTRVDQLMQDSGQVAVHTHISALEKMAELQMELKLVDQAVGTYTKLLDTYEKKKPMASLRYRLGKIFYDRGEIKKAADTWKSFDSDKASIWYKLTQENLQASEWNDDYKKYLNRIPAMTKSQPAGAPQNNSQQRAPASQNN